MPPLLARSLAILLGCLIALSCPLPAAGGVFADEWQQPGLMGEHANEKAAPVPYRLELMNPRLNGLWFDDDGQRGWAAGERGEILHSDDEGRTWRRQSSSTTAEIHALRFLPGGQRGWAVGEEGLILATANGGQRWEPLKSPTRGSLSALYFLPDGQRGWVAGMEGVFATKNGGERWDPVQPDKSSSGAGLALLVHPDGRQEWIPKADGGIALATVDGRQMRIDQGVQGYPPRFAMVLFADGRRGWRVGGRGNIEALGEDGQTWQDQESPTRAHLYAVHFLADGRRGWAAGAGGTILYTANGGGKWDPQSSHTDSDLRGIYFQPDGQRGWAVGDSGVILYTTNGGVAWTPKNGGLKGDLRALQFLNDGQRGWAGGERGVFATTDGGRSWSWIWPNGTGGEGALDSTGAGTGIIENDWILSALHFSADGMQGWFPGQGGLVHVTEDGGKYWRTLAAAKSSSVRGLYVHPDGKRIWLAGGEGIFATRDGGKGGTEWPQQSSERSLTAVHFNEDGQRGWAVGANGVILATKNGREPWDRQESHTKENLSAVQFHADGKRGWVVGDKGTILATSDGGKTWIGRNSSTEVNLFGLGFLADGRRGWAVGPNIILTTADGGLSWTRLADYPDAGLMAVFPDPDGRLGWVGGSHGWVNAGPEEAPGSQGWAGSLLLRLAPEAGAYPVITGYRRALGLPNEEAFDLRIRRPREKDACGTAPLTLDVFYYRPGSENPMASMEAVTQGSRVLDDEHRISIKRKDLNLGTDSTFDLLVFLQCGKNYRASYEMTRLQVRPLTEQIPGGQTTVWILGAVLAYLCLLLGIYAFAPRRLLELRRHTLSLTKMLPKVGPVIGWLASYLGLWLCRRPRVLDAWVAAHGRRWGEGLAAGEPQVFERIYQPLPVAVASAGTEEALPAPGPESLGRFFGPGVRAVQIVAVGGAGKTTLAMQLCRWFLGQGEQPLGRFARLPLWLDQEVADLKEVVDAKLRLLLGEEAPDAEWRDILLNRGRLCLVADRLSEQPKATQGKVCAFHENWPGGLLILTARRPMDLPLPAVHLRPLPLDSLFAISGFIERRMKSKGGEVELQASTGIANALVKALLGAPAAPGKGVGATPLMVELIADTALLLFKEGKDLEELPNSVPDIYFSYVRHLLRSQETGEDVAADGAAQVLLDAAFALAMAAVGERFSPQAFSRNKVMAAQKGNSVLAEAQTFTALEKAGLLQPPVPVGNDAMYRFLLDPVAEYLAAFGYGDECGGDRQRWRDLLAKVGEREERKGFRLALENIYRAYRKLKGYPDRVYPDGLESRQAPNPPELI